MKTSRFRLTVAAIAVFGLSAPVFTAAQDARKETTGAPPWLDWTYVHKFRGHADVHSSSTIGRTEINDRETAKSLDVTSFSFEVEIDRTFSSFGNYHYAPVKVSVAGLSTSSRMSETWNSRQEYQSNWEFSQDLTSDPNMSMYMNLDTGEFTVTLPETLEQPVPMYSNQSQWTADRGTESQSFVEDRTSFVHVSFRGKVPTTPAPLIANWQDVVVDKERGMRTETFGRVMLVPEYEDLEVIVHADFFDPDDAKVEYENWRPRGSIGKPGQSGNYLTVLATLQPKQNQSASDLPNVESFRFELIDTSREPGVAMNWPMVASDNNPDFRMAIYGSPGQMDKDGQEFDAISAENEKGFPQASVMIDSFDFGGRSELRVTAKLEDGRTLYGKFIKGENRYDEMLLPKRRNGDWIAEGWRRENDVVGLADDDDSEDQPEGDGDGGDGLTLYEEYRGFAARKMKGGRVEGDPKRKDLFVLNLIGSDALAGIRTFEEATELRVVHKLDETELDPDYRVINANHREAPWLTDQHGIVLKTVPQSGPGNSGDDPNPLKPATTNFVQMPPRNDPNMGRDVYYIREHPFFASMASYDLELAHRMLRSVGVAHHGEGDEVAEFIFVPDYAKINTKERDMLLKVSKSGTEWVDLRFESGRLVSSTGSWRHRQLQENAKQFFGRSFDILNEFEQWQVMDISSTKYLAGAQSGEHSGDEQCLMRHTVAKVYPARGLIKTQSGRRDTGIKTYYYLVDRQQSEGARLALCESPDGTGFNALTWVDPQSRFWDAASGRGDCAARLCVSDAHAPH